jgi:MFS family permease
MGTHETVMKSAIADITPLSKRGTGYGIFNTAYGVAMLASGAVMGLLYEFSLQALVAVAVAAECVAFALFFVMRREAVKEQST